MISFQDLFTESKGQPIVYKGKTIQMVDCVEISKNQDMVVVFESTNSSWRQGIALTAKGTFIVNDQEIKKGILLWEDTAPSEAKIKINSKDGKCFIKNVWDTGNGFTDSGHNGAAMIVEEIENGRRYRCNDGFADDDFDDLVFRIELQ